MENKISKIVSFLLTSLKEKVNKTELKTINNQSLLGSGNITIESSGGSGGTGSDGLSAYELYVKNIPEGDTPLSEIEWLDSLKGENGKDGVDGDDGLPGVQGPAGPTGAGIQIDAIYPDVESAMVAINDGTIKDRNVVLVENRETLTNTSAYDYFISPDGDDLEGDGSIQAPWKTIANCPRYSRIGLMDGIYDDKDYGQIKPDQYLSMHGLFAFLGSLESDNPFTMTETTKEIVGAPYSNIPVDTPTTLIGAVNPGKVVIKMGTTTQRDYPVVDGGIVSSVFNKLFMVKDVVFDMSRNKGSYSASIARKVKNYGVFLDCQFKETGNYTTSYDSTYPLYVNCNFKGTRLANYQDNSFIEIENEVIPLDYEAWIQESRLYENTLMVYNQAKSHLTPLVSADAMMLLRGRDGEVKVKWEDLTPKQLDSLKKGPKGDNGKSTYEIAVENGYKHSVTQWLKDIGPLDMYQTYLRNTTDEPKLEYNNWLDNMKVKGDVGRPGRDGRDGRDGTVAFESLTEAQLEMLLVNRNIVTRRSTNLLLENVTVNSSLLDISSKMSLPEKIEVTTDEDIVYTIENLKLADPLTAIGDCKYTNVSSDLKFDIFADNSALLAYPLQTNSNDLGGLYNGVDTGVTYADNKAVFDGTAKITPTVFVVPTEMTVSFYVTFTSLGSFMLFDFGGGKAIYMYQDNRIRAQYSNLNNAHKSTTLPMEVGREYFVTAVIKDDSADIYIDGEIQTNKAWANYVTSIGLSIGAKTNNTMPSKMTLRMLRIFKRALTASEILHMYQTTTAEMLELYHASGVTLKDSRIIQKTVSLTVPRYLNEEEAIKYGLTAGDMYYLTDGSVRFVKGL